MNLEKFISFFNILKNIKRKLCEKKPKFIGNNFSLKLAAPPPRQTRSVFKSQIETDHKHRKPIRNSIRQNGCVTSLPKSTEIGNLNNV